MHTEWELNGGEDLCPSTVSLLLTFYTLQYQQTNSVCEQVEPCPSSSHELSMVLGYVREDGEMPLIILTSKQQHAGVVAMRVAWWDT